MATDLQTNSFAFGELSPEIYGRNDLQQYRQAAAELKNILIQPNGSAKRRPGVLFVDNLSGETRLITMQISATESLILAMKNAELTIYDRNGNVKKSFISGIPWSQANLWDVQFVQTKYEMVFVSEEFEPHLLEYKIADPSTSTFTAIQTIPPPSINIFPTFSDTAGNRPRTVTFNDERLVLGGTENEPNAIWGSVVKGLYRSVNAVCCVDFNPPFLETRTATYSKNVNTMTVSSAVGLSTGLQVLGPGIATGATITAVSGTTVTLSINTVEAGTNVAVDFSSVTRDIRDDSPYAFILLDSGYIDIQWMKATSTIQEGFLIVGTTWGVYAIIGGGPGGAITPASPISPRPQTTTGCANIQPISADGLLAYVDASRRDIRVLQFSLEGNQLQAEKITQLSNHLFEADIKEMHYQRTPNSIIWVLLETGKLLAFSYSSTGGLSAWTKMDFGDTKVDSLCVGLGENEDFVAFSMKDDNDYWLGEFALQNEPDQVKQVFLDKAIIKENSTPFNVVDGLDELEGEDVQIWANGAAHPDRTVENNEVSLNREVTYAVVGRKYETKITTLPIPEATTLIKRVSRIFVRFLNTIGAFAGTDEFEEIVPFREGNFIMDEPPALFTGVKEIPYQGRHERDGSVTIYTDGPGPFHVLSLSTRVEAYNR